MKTICCSCDAYMSGDKKSEITSHGYCPTCAQAFKDSFINNKDRYMKFWDEFNVLDYFYVNLKHVGASFIERMKLVGYNKREMSV